MTDKSNKTNKATGKNTSRKRRPVGYPERHAKAQEWADQNPNINNILQGRKTDYKPQYCLDVLYAGKLGKSLTQVARDIGVSRRAFNRWADKYKDFRLAMEISKEWQVAWAEDAALGHISGTIKGSHSMLRFMMVNLAPDKYADIKVIEARMANKPADEAPPIDFAAIPMEDRMKLMQGFRKLAMDNNTPEPIEDAVVVEG